MAEPDRIFSVAFPADMSAAWAGPPIGNYSRCNEPVPHEEDNHSAYRSADESCTLIGTIPTDCLADKGRDKCADYPEHGGENETRWIVRTWREYTRYDTCDEAD